MVALPLYAIAIMHTDDLCELAQKELTRARALARGWLSRLIELKLCQHDCDQDRLPQLLLHAQRDVHAIERSTHLRKPAEVEGRSLPWHCEKQRLGFAQIAERASLYAEDATARAQASAHVSDRSIDQPRESDASRHGGRFGRVWHNFFR